MEGVLGRGLLLQSVDGDDEGGVLSLRGGAVLYWLVGAVLYCLVGAVLYRLIGALLDWLVGALETSAPPTSVPTWRGRDVGYAALYSIVEDFKGFGDAQRCLEDGLAHTRI